MLATTTETRLAAESRREEWTFASNVEKLARGTTPT